MFLPVRCCYELLGALAAATHRRKAHQRQQSGGDQGEGGGFRGGNGHVGARDRVIHGFERIEAVVAIRSERDIDPIAHVQRAQIHVKVDLSREGRRENRGIIVYENTNLIAAAE